MPRNRLGIWSPHRNSNSVLALKAALRLRSEKWKWCDSPDDASFWIVDTQIPFFEVTQQLKEVRQGQERVFAAALATEWSMLHDPVWTFLKVPLQIKILYQWIDGCLRKLPVDNVADPDALYSTWVGQQLKLKRWPNMSSYAGTHPVTSVQVTAVCGRLLADWVRYEDLCNEVAEVAVLYQLLADAHERGILEMKPNPELHSATSAIPASAAIGIASADAATESEGRWSLIKRLMRKLA